MPAGRPKIARGEIHKRAFWKDVTFGDSRPEAKRQPVGGVYRGDDAMLRNLHWFWERDSPMVYGHWKPSGERIERVLFAELRPPEWDGRGARARLVRNCEDEQCINPWHWDVRTGIGATKRDEYDAARALPMLADSASLTDRILALELYRWIVESYELGNPLSALLINVDGRWCLAANRGMAWDDFIEEHIEWSSPYVVALAEIQLNRETPMRLDEVDSHIARLKRQAESERKSRIAGLDAIIVAARTPAKSGVKPKPPGMRRLGQRG